MGGILLKIEVDEEGSNYQASGNMSSGLIMKLIGELEKIKHRLLIDYERSTEDGY